MTGITSDDMDECWCCGGLHDSPGTLCPDCDDADCNRFSDECESDHQPAMADGGSAESGQETPQNMTVSGSGDSGPDDATYVSESHNRETQYIQCLECETVRLAIFTAVPDSLNRESCRICGEDTEHRKVSVEVTPLE